MAIAHTQKVGMLYDDINHAMVEILSAKVRETNGTRQREIPEVLLVHLLP